MLKVEKLKLFRNNFLKMKYLICFFISCISILSCKQKDNDTKENIVVLKNDTLLQINYYDIFKEKINYISEGFDFPVGKPDAKGYYNAQKFQENNHLGDDWNGIGGGNSDIGDSIYSISNGYISEVKDYKGGWCKVLRIVHLYEGKLYESLYAHCDSILIAQGKFIKKGEKIATIGNCNDNYLAHLHLEIRNKVGLDIGGGYSTNTKGYLDPTNFINKNR